MQLTQEMRDVLKKADEEEGYWASHVVIFPLEKGSAEKNWEYDWDAYFVRGYDKAQDYTADLALRGIQDSLIVALCKL